MRFLMRFFPSLGAGYKRLARGSKNGSNTKRGPGRYHVQGKKPD